MSASNQHSEQTSSEQETTLGAQVELRHHMIKSDTRPVETLSKFRNLLNATREASKIRQENKHNRVDPFQTLVYECLPEDGAPLPFPLLCLLVTGRLHSRFPSKSDKRKIRKAVQSLQNHGMVTSERVSTGELKEQGYNLPGFYCKMIHKKPHKRINGFKRKPNHTS